MRPTLVSLVLSLVASLSAAGTLQVTNTNDSGPGSFRAALETVNARQCGFGNCIIEFAIPAPVPERGWFTIRPLSPLPEILPMQGLVIDGTAQTRLTGQTNPFGPEIELDGSEAGFATGLKMIGVSSSRIAGLTINNFQANGVSATRCQHFSVNDNYIGVDPTGTEARPNGMNGVLFVAVSPGQIFANIISGNRGNGVYIHDGHINVSGNRIGAGRTTRHVLGNGANGVNISTIISQVDANVITFNRDHGITVGSLSKVVQMNGNELWGNGLLSIDLGHNGVDDIDPFDADNGANGRMNAPQLERAELHGQTQTAVRIRGKIVTRAHAEINLHFYAAPHRSNLGLAETKVRLGELTLHTDGDGVGTFDQVITEYNYDNRPAPSGGYVTATAYFQQDGTSELAAPVPLLPGANLNEVTTTADSGSGSLRSAIERANAALCIDAIPCRIAFRLPEGETVIEPESELPALTADYVIVDGSTQRYWTNEDVELRGTNAGASATGLRVGTAERRVTDSDVRELAVTNFNGDGIVAWQTGLGLLSLSRLSVRENGGNGVVIFGGVTTDSVFFQQPGGISASEVSRNRRHGVVLAGDATHARDVRANGNGFHGIFVRGIRSSVAGSTAIGNGGDGIATSREARPTAIDAATSGNGGIGIDRDDDGPGISTDQVTAAPELVGAYWDEARRMTVIRLRGPESVARFRQPNNSSNTFFSYRLYTDVAVPLLFALFTTPVDGELEAAIPVDLRGQTITLTRTVSFCYWEFGCWPWDTSELSNRVTVE